MREPFSVQTPAERPYGGVVRLLDRLLGRAEGEHREHRPEDLLLRDPVALGDVREDGRREPEAALGQRALGLEDLGALLSPARDELLDPLELLAGVDRADVGVLVERVADAQRAAMRRFSLREGLLVDRLLHEQARAGAADLALVEVDPVDDPLDRLVERAVVEDDVRGLAAELERELACRCRRSPAGSSLPTSVEPVKAILSMPGCATIAAPVRPSPVTMLTTPGGSSACRQTSAKRSAVSGVVCDGFSTTVLPHASAGAIFQASISSGKFQGMICPATPSGRGRRFGNAYSSLSAQPA